MLGGLLSSAVHGGVCGCVESAVVVVVVADHFAVSIAVPSAHRDGGCGDFVVAVVDFDVVAVVVAVAVGYGESDDVVVVVVADAVDDDDDGCDS